MNRNNESDQLNEKEGMNSAWAWALEMREETAITPVDLAVMSHQHQQQFFAFTETAKFRNRTMCKKNNHHTNAELINVWKSTFYSWDARGRHHVDHLKKPSCAIGSTQIGEVDHEAKLFSRDFKKMCIYTQTQ